MTSLRNINLQSKQTVAIFMLRVSFLTISYLSLVCSFHSFFTISNTFLISFLSHVYIYISLFKYGIYFEIPDVYQINFLFCVFSSKFSLQIRYSIIVICLIVQATILQSEHISAFGTFTPRHHLVHMNLWKNSERQYNIYHTDSL